MKLFQYAGAVFLLPRNIWYLKERAQKRSYQIAYYLKLKALGSYVGHNCVMEGIPCLPHGLKGIFISGGGNWKELCNLSTGYYWRKYAG